MEEKKVMLQISEENANAITNFMLSGKFDVPMSTQVQMMNLVQRAFEPIPEKVEEVK